MRRIFFAVFIALSVVFTGAAVSSAADGVKVVFYSGKVGVTPPGSAKTETPYADMMIKDGSEVVTGKASFLNMAFDRDKLNLVKVGENSRVVVHITGDSQIELIDGKILASLGDLKGGTFKVKTPSAVCGARGTGWQTTSGSNGTNVAVFDSRVFVSGLAPDGAVTGAETTIGEGFEAQVGKDGKVGGAHTMRGEKLNGLHSESEELEASAKYMDYAPDSRPAQLKQANSIVDIYNNMNSERRESITGQKDEERLDDMRDRERRRDNSGSRMIKG